VREGFVVRDFTENLRPPKAFRGLLRYLTFAQVDALLSAPDVATPVGLRDRAVLEMMYATGLRASELTGLATAGVDLELGVVRVLRKGRKERLVPSAAGTVVEACPRSRGPRRARGRPSPLLFLSTRAAACRRPASGGSCGGTP
jgi:integrase/recombinase XerD